MTETNDLIARALHLPVEERVRVVDAIMSTLNVADDANDTVWTERARARLNELRGGRVRPVAYSEVVNEISRRIVG